MGRDLFNRYPGAVSGNQRALSRVLATGRGGGMRLLTTFPLAVRSRPDPTVQAHACWNVPGSFSLPALSANPLTNRQRRFPQIHSGLPIGAPGIAVKQLAAENPSFVVLDAPFYLA